MLLYNAESRCQIKYFPLVFLFQVLTFFSQFFPLALFPSVEKVEAQELTLTFSNLFFVL